MAAASPGGTFAPLEIDRLFAPLIGASGVLVAVSGGPDSMALLHLLARWGRAPLLAATVDHGLRPGSAEEAGLVSEAAARLGVPHRTLLWSGPKPVAGLQEAARDARYRLLAALCREEGLSHLVTAHTLDDQAETVLMRLARGSGLSGLAAMRSQVEREGILHARPLLGLPKAALVDLCRREAWPFVADPSNADPRFARARWRRLMPLLAEEGLTAQRLARFAERARRADDALEALARDALDAARQERGLNGAFLIQQPAEIALRVLLLAVLGEEDEGDHPRLQRFEAALARLRDAFKEGRSLRLSLAGRVLSLARDGTLHVVLEPPRRRGR